MDQDIKPTCALGSTAWLPTMTGWGGCRCRVLYRRGLEDLSSNFNPYPHADLMGLLLCQSDFAHKKQASMIGLGKAELLEYKTGGKPDPLMIG